MLATAGAGRALPTFGNDPRPEYQRLLVHLKNLAQIFGLCLSSASRANAAVLVGAVECVDRVLDRLPGVDQRTALAVRVNAALSGDSSAQGEISPEFDSWLEGLAALAAGSIEPRRFREITREVLHNAERMRNTSHIRSLVQHAVREGELFVELLLLVLNEPLPPGLARFLRTVAGPANLWDKFLDARDDGRRGELACRPVIVCQAGLLLAIGFRLIPLASLVVAKPALAPWGLRGLCAHCADTWRRRS